MKHKLTLEVVNRTGEPHHPRDIARIVMNHIKDIPGFEVSSIGFTNPNQTEPTVHNGIRWDWPSRDAAKAFKAHLVVARRLSGLTYEELSYFSGYAVGTLRKYEDSYSMTCPRNFLCLELPLGLAPNTLFRYTGFTLGPTALQHEMRVWQHKLSKTHAYRGRNSGKPRPRAYHVRHSYGY